MRGNRIKQKLQAGAVTLAITGHSISSDTIDFCGQLGFDGFWIEGEHGSAAWEHLGDQTRACDLWGMTSILRVHDHEPGRITRALDLGVNGIAVPHVNTRQQAEQVVNAAYYAPIGTRGAYGSGRRGYGDPEYLHKVNDETLVILLIEEVAALQQLDEILAVPQVDLFFVAPSDLAQSMGYLGGRNRPEVQQVVLETLHRIGAAGRVAGTVGYDEAMLETYIARGARFFLINYDAWIKQGAGRYLQTVAEVTR